MKKAGIFFATGYEEIEALTVVDLLRRAGIEAVCVSIDNQKSVTGSHQQYLIVVSVKLWQLEKAS